ncbi:hypothetical protein ACED51_07680 [Photobacterium swingsii]|uniref:hypothetical protein n=1 Tax=Photobacterium swingsii TaxID=680026 RepID=UPI00352BEB51
MDKTIDMPTNSRQETKLLDKGALPQSKLKATLSLILSQGKYFIALMGLIAGSKLSVWFPLALTQLYLKVF